MKLLKTLKSLAPLWLFSDQHSFKFTKGLVKVKWNKYKLKKITYLKTVNQDTDTT